MLKLIFAGNDFSGGNANKSFDTHHKEDRIWLVIVNQSNIFIDVFDDGGNLRGIVGESSTECILLDPRPINVVLQQRGNGAATINGPGFRVFAGIFSLNPKPIESHALNFS